MLELLLGTALIFTMMANMVIGARWRQRKTGLIEELPTPAVSPKEQSEVHGTTTTGGAPQKEWGVCVVPRVLAPGIH